MIWFLCRRRFSLLPASLAVPMAVFALGVLLTGVLVAGIALRFWGPLFLAWAASL